MKDTELDFARECLEECKNLYLENKYEDAVLLIRRAKEIFEDEKSYVDICHALNMLGIIHATFGDMNTSVDYYLAGMDIAAEHRLDDELSLFYNNLGSEYQELKDYEHALKLYTDAYETIKDLPVAGDHKHVIYLNLCNTYYSLQNYEEASRFLQLAEELNPEVEDYDKLGFFITKCRLENRLGHRQQAEDLIPLIMELVTKDVSGVSYREDMNELALALIELDKKETAYFLMQWIDENTRKRYGDEMDTQIRIWSLELKLKFLKAFHDDDEYRNLCVELCELRTLWQKVENQRRAANMDIRIELHNKDNEWLKAEKKSNIDALTGVRNRYKLKDDGQAAIKESQNGPGTLAVGILDLDYFKQVNDNYGHIIGDRYLRAVAETATDALPEGGSIYRYGGDEFVVILRNSSKEDAESFASRIRQELAGKKLENKASEVSEYLTLSQGYCILTPKSGDTIWNLIESADAVLYDVKQKGKNAYFVKNMQ